MKYNWIFKFVFIWSKGLDDYSKRRCRKLVELVLQNTWKFLVPWVSHIGVDSGLHLRAKPNDTSPDQQGQHFQTASPPSTTISIHLRLIPNPSFHLLTASLTLSTTLHQIWFAFISCLLFYCSIIYSTSFHRSWMSPGALDSKKSWRLYPFPSQNFFL